MTLIVVAKEKQAEHSALAQFQLPIFLWSSQEKVQDTRDIDSKVCAVSNCLGVGALLNFSLQKGLVALIPRRVFFCANQLYGPALPSQNLDLGQVPEAGWRMDR